MKFWVKIYIIFYNVLLAKYKIHVTSNLAQVIYKKILRVARKKGDDWIYKIKNESISSTSFNDNNNNIFTHNLVENSGAFSFGGLNNLKDFKKVSDTTSAIKPFSKHHILDDSLNHELIELKLSKDLDDTEQNEPLTVDNLVKESLNNPQNVENSQNSNDFSAIYRNASFKQTDYISRSNVNIIQPHPYPEKFREQSPPTRDYNIKLASDPVSPKKSLKAYDEIGFRKYYRDQRNFDTMNDRSPSLNFINDNKMRPSESPNHFISHSFNNLRSHSIHDEKLSINLNSKNLKKNSRVRFVERLKFKFK